MDKISTIMVIDDSEADQFICSHAIRQFNPSISIIRAFDGQEALDYLDDLKNSPDIIFLDVNMPRMNGHEFLVQYSKRNSEKLSTVIILTSSDQQKDKDRTLVYDNVKSYVLKPLDAVDIENLVKSIH